MKPETPRSNVHARSRILMPTRNGFARRLPRRESRRIRRERDAARKHAPPASKPQHGGKVHHHG